MEQGNRQDMKHRTTQTHLIRRGFTLVELSVVLVIIGLLLGGLMIGSDMVNTAKINSTIRQLGYYDSVINNFRNKYEYYPGDCCAPGGPGNANNALDGTEAQTFWPQLSALEEFKASDGTNYVNWTTQYVTLPTERMLPRLPLDQRSNPGKAGLAPVTFSFNGVSKWALNYRYYDGTAMPSLDSVRPSDLLAIDKKADDGRARSGNISHQQYGGGGCDLFSHTEGGVDIYLYNVSGAGYTTEYLCTPFFAIGQFLSR